MTLFCLVVILAGCSAEPDARREPESRTRLRPRQGYILISFDTLRADHLGAYGYERNTSPCFDRLARRGALFERTVAQYPSTLTSHMSIFTGLYPQEHQVLPPSTILAETIATLPERFQAGGFRTAGHTEGGFVAGGYGFNRGFEEFTDSAYVEDTDVQRTFGRGLDFVRRLGEGERFFLFLHTYTVHDPYDPPEAYRSLFWPGPPPEAFSSSGENLRRINRGEIEISPEVRRYFEALYDASIRYADDVLAGFVEALAELELMGDTTLVITSDHGEEFLEHGKMAHTQIYPETILVPLLIVHPDHSAPRRVEAIVQTVDIAPTLYDLARLPETETVSGRSLVPFLEGSSLPTGSTQGYAEVLEADFVRTLVARDRDRPFQLMVIEPEWDPTGPWIRREVEFDSPGPGVKFEARSFHTTRRVRIFVEGHLQEEIEVSPTWTPVAIELPSGRSTFRLRMEAEGCVSPAEVGVSEDDRCLAFQVRSFVPRRFELYDLVSDPGAKVDLFRRQPVIGKRLAERLLDLRWSPKAEAVERPLSQSDEEALRALGYLD